MHAMIISVCFLFDDIVIERLNFGIRIRVKNMNIKVNSNMITKYNQTKIDMEHVKLKINEHKAEKTKKTDEVCISEEGKIALEKKMMESFDESVPHIEGKISDISSQYYIDTFGEKLLESEKSKDMDAVFKKMKTLHQELQEDIKTKYNNEKNEEVFFINGNGVIEELTMDKEMELLDQAYEAHKMLITNSMKIWEKDFGYGN